MSSSIYAITANYGRMQTNNDAFTINLNLIVNHYTVNISNVLIIKLYAANYRAITSLNNRFFIYDIYLTIRIIYHTVKSCYAFTSQPCFRRSAIRKFFLENQLFSSYLFISKPYTASMSNTIYISCIARCNLSVFINSNILRLILQLIYSSIIGSCVSSKVSCV